MTAAAAQFEIPGIPAPEPKQENGSTAIMRIVERLALDPTADASKLATLLEVKLKWEADEARKAYIAAMQRFKANPPKVDRTRHVHYGTKSGDKVDYWHAELDNVTEIIANALRAVGIYHTWRTSDENGRTTVSCVLTHEMGHTEVAATLSGPPDTSGGKNSIQAIGSTKTYLERYTLLAATGLAVEGMDDDGKTEGLPEQTIADYCVSMQDTCTYEELRPIFKECWAKAKAANDPSAQERFRKVYEQRKRDFRD